MSSCKQVVSSCVAEYEGGSVSTSTDELKATCTEGRDDHDERDGPCSESWLYMYSIDAAATPLFEGSSVSVVQTLVQYFRWFCEHPGISKEALSSMLAMHHTSILPQGNKLPSTYKAALRAIEPYLVQPIVYDVCPNDCTIFRGEYGSLSECPKCGGARYVSDQSSIPARRFTYLPLKPHFSRLFGTFNMAQVLQSHAVVKSSETEAIYDIQQSPAWKNAYANSGLFQGDPRGVSLALCTDGVNPFAHNKVSYSMWIYQER